MAKKILVADDNRSQLILIQNLLEGRGYSVIIANDGQEAVEKALQCLPDLIVLDVQMPHMEGDEAAMHIKSKEETKRIPIIFVTGLRTDKEIEENKEENIFAKPLKLELFLNKVKELLGEGDEK